MLSRIKTFAPHILAATRILVGISLASHGAQKLGAFGGVPQGVPGHIVWVAGPLELAFGTALALGLFTAPVAFVLSGLMAFAYFLGHAGRGFWPVLNGGELAIVYSWLSLYFVANGPGAWALDNLRARGAGQLSETEAPSLRTA